MKTIGLIGGISPESTVDYYTTLNRLARERLGGHHSAKIVLQSVDFGDVVALQQAGRWDELAAYFIDLAKKLEKAGADCLLIGANTMHKIAPHVAEQISIPLLHVAEITGFAIKQASCKRPLLLGTRYTMTSGFYAELLEKLYDLEPVAPVGDDVNLVHGIIYNELAHGRVETASKASLLELIDRFKTQKNIDAVILGCTELPMILKNGDYPLPFFNTTELHCRAASAFSFGESWKENLRT